MLESCLGMSIHLSCLFIVQWLLLVLLNIQKLLLLSIHVLKHVSFWFSHRLAWLWIRILVFVHLWWVILSSLIHLFNILIIKRPWLVQSRSLRWVRSLLASFGLRVTFVLCIWIYSCPLYVNKRSWIQYSTITKMLLTSFFVLIHGIAYHTWINRVLALFVLLWILHSSLSACHIWMGRMLSAWLSWCWFAFWNLNRQGEWIEESNYLFICQFVQVFWDWNAISSKLTCFEKSCLFFT